MTIQNGFISTTIYEKPENLHLYISPHSNHSPGVLKGLIFGCAYRAFHLCSNTDDGLDYLRRTFDRLRQRGHSASSLQPIFDEAINRFFNNMEYDINLDKKKNPLFLHLPYNPYDTSSKDIQRLFKDTIVKPPNDVHLTSLECLNRFQGKPDFDTLTICYHGVPNLGNMLSPSNLRLGSFSIDQYINEKLNK